MCNFVVGEVLLLSGQTHAVALRCSQGNKHDVDVVRFSLYSMHITIDVFCLMSLVCRRQRPACLGGPPACCAWMRPIARAVSHSVLMCVGHNDQL